MRGLKVTECPAIALNLFDDADAGYDFFRYSTKFDNPACRAEMLELISQLDQIFDMPLLGVIHLQ